MREWVGFPPFIKDPAKLNKFYKDVSLTVFSYQYYANNERL